MHRNGGQTDRDPAQGWAARLTAVSTPADRTNADALLQRAARGDEAAFTALYDLVTPRVYGLVRRVLRDPAQAEEVTQEVLVEVGRTGSPQPASRRRTTTWWRPRAPASSARRCVAAWKT